MFIIYIISVINEYSGIIKEVVGKCAIYAGEYATLLFSILNDISLPINKTFHKNSAFNIYNWRYYYAIGNIKRNVQESI